MDRPRTAGQMWTAAIGVAALTLVAGSTLMAQDKSDQKKTSTIIGIVADTNKTPLEGADVVALKSQVKATTNGDGIFVLSGIPAGDEQVQVRRIGFQPQTFDATVAGGDTVRIGIILAADAIVLPEVGVVARGRTYRGAMVGFANRMLNSNAPPSAFVTREDIEKSGLTRVLDIVSKRGILTRFANGGRVPQCPRGYTSNQPPYPVIYVNGARTFGSFDIDNLDIEQVEAMEIYTSPIHTPEEFRRDAPCVIVLWTRGG